MFHNKQIKIKNFLYNYNNCYFQMNKLPTETVVDITSHLPFADKLNLACANKQLYKTISENFLYSKLVFTKENNFYQAIDLHNEKNIGQQVRYLWIQDVNHDAELVSYLPTMFPRVRFVKLDSRLVERYTEDYDVGAIHWKNVETIVDCHYIINETMYLLKLMTFDHLTSLELICVWDRQWRRSQIENRHERTQALIGGIHNAPLLEKLVQIQHSKLKMLNVYTRRHQN